MKLTHQITERIPIIIYYAINYGSLDGSKIVIYKSQNKYHEIVEAHNNHNYLPAD